MGGGIEIDDEYRLILVGVSFLFFFSFSILDTEIRGLAMEEAWKEGLYVFTLEENDDGDGYFLIEAKNQFWFLAGFLNTFKDF